MNETRKRALATDNQNQRNSEKRKQLSDSIDVLEYFSHARPFSNVKIIFNQTTIWCDKAPLAAASPVFTSMLLKENNQVELVTLENIELEEFLLLLQFIYPLFNPEINEKNISSLIRLADRFQFGSLLIRTMNLFNPSL